MAGYFSPSPSRFSSSGLSSSLTTAESPLAHRPRLATATSKLPAAPALRDASSGPKPGEHPLKHTYVRDPLSDLVDSSLQPVILTLLQMGVLVSAAAISGQ
jgi:hypothetical protein